MNPSSLLRSPWHVGAQAPFWTLRMGVWGNDTIAVHDLNQPIVVEPGILYTATTKPITRTWDDGSIHVRLETAYHVRPVTVSLMQYIPPPVGTKRP
jgi:hypothetical protein